MSNEEQGPFKVGNFVAPLTASTTNPLLKDADPAIFHSLKFFAGVLDIHLGDRWTAAATLAGLSQATIVGTQVPYDPAPYLTDVQYQLPILALYRTVEDYSEKTRHYSHLEASWTLQWIMPPLSAAQHLQMYGFLSAVAKVIFNRTNLGYDPEYNSGELVFATGGLEEISIKEARYGGIAASQAQRGSGTVQTNLFFPTVEFEISAKEIRGDLPIDDLEGLDGSIAIKDSAGQTTIIDFSEDLT